MEDVQNRSAWYESGQVGEDDFIVGHPEYAINPRKSTDVTAPDLIRLLDGAEVELKRISTPFYLAWRRHGIPPERAVQFGLTPYLRHRRDDINIPVLFDINFPDSEGYGIKVAATRSLVQVPFVRLAEKIEKLNFSDLHFHKERTPYIQGATKRWMLPAMKVIAARHPGIPWLPI